MLHEKLFKIAEDDIKEIEKDENNNETKSVQIDNSSQEVKEVKVATKDSNIELDVNSPNIQLNATSEPQATIKKEVIKKKGLENFMEEDIDKVAGRGDDR